MSGGAEAEVRHPRAGPRMPNILTSWKEIGQYLGKGVRTVQRWEREAALPVRRQEPSRRAVLALTEELDEWARSQRRGPSMPLADSLRKEMIALREETSDLRRRLEVVEKECSAFSPANGGDSRDGMTSSYTALQCRSQVIRGRAIRCRISYASTLCAMSEFGYSISAGEVQHAWRSVQMVRQSLDRPGYVASSELHELDALLRELESRLLRVEPSGEHGRGSMGSGPVVTDGRAV